jgi:hypothetical protein
MKPEYLALRRSALSVAQEWSGNSLSGGIERYGKKERNPILIRSE